MFILYYWPGSLSPPPPPPSLLSPLADLHPPNISGIDLPQFCRRTKHRIPSPVPRAAAHSTRANPPPAPSVQLAAGARPCQDTTRQPITRAWSHCKPIEGAAHNQSELLPPSVIGRSPVPGGDQSYLTTTCCWYNNKMSARPTSVRARPVAPRDSPLMSAIFVCARRAVGKIFLNFCRALDSRPLSSSTILGTAGY